MKAAIPSTRPVRTADTAPRAVTWLLGGYLTLSMATVLAVVAFSAIAPSLVNPEAQVRSVIVAATSVLTLMFARRAIQGRPRALLRLRIVVAVILVAIVAVVFFLPLPPWMVVEQAACGVLLAATAVLIFRPAQPVTARRGR
jgi:hypothetical protein